jgi:serine/threonine protein kinase
MARIVIGDVIAGKYCVERAIAEGSTGTVFAARHLELDQPVAIKVLFEEVAARSVAAERFRRQARAAARMQGPHVCRVLDIGAQPDGTPFMVMEYLEGCHLGRELERRGRLTPEEAFECIFQACDAVAEAHAAGIVHRDLKPANMFWAVLPDGSRHMKLLGFGVSKALAGSRASESPITMASTITGAPAYLSPEQLDAAQDIDERTDIWSLAVVFYELISGRVPFYGDSIPALVRAVLNAKPKPLSELQVGAGPDRRVRERAGAVRADQCGRHCAGRPKVVRGADQPRTDAESRAPLRSGSGRERRAQRRADLARGFEYGRGFAGAGPLRRDRHRFLARRGAGRAGISLGGRG